MNVITATLTKTHATKLTPEETARAAGFIKILAASRGFTQYASLHAKLAAAGYPASYATFGRLMNASRVAQRSEIDLIARYFNVQTRDLIGAAADPVKDPAPARLIEFEAPRPAVAEGPAELLPVKFPGRPGSPSRARTEGVGLRAIADAVESLAAAVREQTAWQKSAVWPGVDGIRQAG